MSDQIPGLVTAMQSSTVRQQMTNFPLPRELRDELYAYLLDVERVEEVAEECEIVDLDCRTHATQGAEFEGPRKTYNFSVAILAVNKTIGAEARTYFEKHNRFVRVQFHVRGFHMLRAMTDLPVIASVKGKRMEQHCLSIRIAWSRLPNTAGRVVDFIARHDSDRGTIVIALQSLPKLCNILRFLSAIELPAVPVVASARGEGLRVFCPGSDPEKRPGALQTKVLASDRSLKAMALDEVEQALVLDSFEGIRAGGYAFSVAGVGDISRIIAITNETAPALIFPAAFVLDYLAVLRQTKQHADALLTAGHPMPAHNRYSALGLWQSCSWSDIQGEFFCLTDTGHRALYEVMHLVECFATDIMCSALALAVFHRTSHKIQATRSMLDVKQHTMTPRSLSWYKHLSVLADIVDVQSTTMPFMVPQLHILIHSYNTLKTVPMADDWIAYDLEKLMASIVTAREYFYTDKQIARPSPQNLLLQLSLWTMPFRIYDSTTDPDIPPLGRSEDFVGWEDRAHLAELTKKDEPAVHGWQKSMGLPLSTFG